MNIEFFSRFWTSNEISTNLAVIGNLMVALVLGLVVGYERAYHGRAAGMRTYAIVCVASCAVTVIAGFPSAWYGGVNVVTPESLPDPTRVIQGVLTGVGFLGAGIITKDSNNTNGLTTAASIWSASVIGIMVGVGFHAAAILFTALSVILMVFTIQIEKRLPSRPIISISLKFIKGYHPEEGKIKLLAQDRGYEISEGSLQIKMIAGQQEWRFNASATERKRCAPVAQLTSEIAMFEGVDEFSVSSSRT